MDTMYELVHWGVKGMKWGVRRYQNKDGTLTNAGKKRYNKEMEKLEKEARILKNKQRTQAKLDKLDAKRKEVGALKNKTESSQSKTKSIKDLSDDELRSKINRLEMEKRLSDLTSQDRSRGKGFAQTVGNEMLKPAAINIGKQLVTSALTAAANKAFDLNSEGKSEYKVYTNNKKKN